MTTTTDLQRALQYLDGHRCGRGRYAYEASDEGSPRRYIVDAQDMRDLGARLRRGEPDAYSLWCGATLALGEALSHGR